MKSLLFFLFFCSSFFLFGQKQGIWYFTSQGNLCSEFEANVKLVLKESAKNVYKELVFFEKNDSWEVPNSFRQYQFENDTICTIRFFTDKTLKKTFKRVYRKLNDSLYAFTDFENDRLIMKGTSFNVLPILYEGKIEAYFTNGNKKSETIYSNHKFISKECWNIKGEKEIDTVFEIEQVDVKPIFMEGDLLSFISKRLEYPFSAAASKIQGKVYVQFVVMEDGSVNGVKILRSADPMLDKEAQRVVKLTDGKWTPATIKNEPVKVFFNMPISFLLQ